MTRPKQANLRRLRALMQKFELKADDVARRLGVTTRRVYGWLSVGQTTPIPTTKLRLLELLSREDELVPRPLLSRTPAPRPLLSRTPAPRPQFSLNPAPTKKRIRKTKKKPRSGKLR